MLGLFRWLTLLGLVSISTGLSLEDPHYDYLIPKSCALDHYEDCLSQPGGVYCYGSFELVSADDHATELLHALQVRSSTTENFNRTWLQRGYCVSSSCASDEGSTPEEKFQNCVDRIMREQHGIRTRLKNLDYCRRAKERTPVDDLDRIYLACVLGVVAMSVVGTIYDMNRDRSKKPYKLLHAFSLPANWRALVDIAPGNAQDEFMLPINGFRVFVMYFVISSHASIAVLRNCILNPRQAEMSIQNVVFAPNRNGTSGMMSFFTISSFIFAYKKFTEYREKKTIPSIMILPKWFISRLIRLLPCYIFVMGMTMTWWVHLSDGPLWHSTVSSDRYVCRKKWWTQLLFINNIIDVGEQCIVTSWSMAVESQLFLFTMMLTLVALRWPQHIPRMAVVGVVACIANSMAVIYNNQYKLTVTATSIESMRTYFKASREFHEWFVMPWPWLPSCFLGIYLADLQLRLQAAGTRVNQIKWFIPMAQYGITLCFLWFFAGYFLRHTTDPFLLAVFGTAERIIFTFFFCFFLMGLINKVDGSFLRFLSWRGFVLLGKLSYPVALMHWFFNMSIPAVAIVPNTYTLYNVIGNVLLTLVASHLVAVPVYLLIDRPLQRFLQALLF